MAVIVNDMSEVNIDAATINRDVSLIRGEEQLIEPSNGCICCTLREDLLLEVSRLANAGRVDYLLIESTGIASSTPVCSQRKSWPSTGSACPTLFLLGSKRTS